MKHLHIFALLFFCMSIVSCDQSNTPASNDDAQSDGSSEEAKVTKVGGRLFSIPSPAQTAILIKKSGAEYTNSILSDYKDVSKYDSKIQQGLNLGVYGADLGYVNLYNQTQDAVHYLNSVKKLSDELGISSAFTPEFVEKFQDNLGNTDSLLLLVSDAYKMVDAYLEENENNDLGALVLAGGWVEALYFTTKIYKDHKTAELKQRIGEQKFSISNLIEMMVTFSNNDSDQYKELVEALQDLEQEYNQVTASYEYADPQVNEEEKLTVIKNKTTVDISDEVIEQISSKIAQIRSSIVE